VILTLHDSERSFQFEIGTEDFLRLRRTSLSPDELSALALRYAIPLDILSAYVNESTTIPEEAAELDGACDYTDHFS